MDLTFALDKFRLFGADAHRDFQLEDEDRVRISRTRRSIDLQEQELIHLALLQERQQSA